MGTPENRRSLYFPEKPNHQEFSQTVESVSEHAKIIYNENFGSQFTQIVLGVRHYLPSGQRDILGTLTSLKTQTDFKLLGTEGRDRSAPIPQDYPIDYEKASTDDDYMTRLLMRNINATTLFGHKYKGDVITQSVEDPKLRALAGTIDQNYYEIFSLRKEKGKDNLTPEEEDEYRFWQEKEKQIVLGDRSNAMIRNLSKLQRETNAATAVLVCGFSHLHLRPEYGLTSILPRQRKENVNIILAMPNESWEIYNATKDIIEPFDFFTSVDNLEVNSYKKRGE